MCLDALVCARVFAGTDMTPNYVDSSFSHWTISPWCTCKGSGNQEEECANFLQSFTDNTCLSEPTFLKCFLTSRLTWRRSKLKSGCVRSSAPKSATWVARGNASPAKTKKKKKKAKVVIKLQGNWLAVNDLARNLLRVIYDPVLSQL